MRYAAPDTRERHEVIEVLVFSELIVDHFPLVLL